MHSNSDRSYGSVARSLHWVTALLILAKSRLFSIHKTLGVTLFAVALMRISWAIVQPKPVELHRDRKLETYAARTVHWVLYGSLVLVP